MHKMAIHAENFKCGAVGAMEKHNLRKNKNYSNQEIDPERTKENIVLKEPEHSQYQDTKKIIEERATNQVRSTSVWQTEFVVSSSQEFFKELPRDEQNRFFREAYGYLSKEFGERNVTCAVVHYDETTPHMHFDFVPMTEDNRLSRKEVMTRERLLKIQDELPRHLREKGFEIERGRRSPKLDEKYKIRHRSTEDYKKSVNEAYRALQRQEKAIHSREKKLDLEKLEVQKGSEELKKRREKLLNEVNVFEEQIKNINGLPNGDRTITGKIAMKEEEYKRLRDEAKKGIVLEQEYKRALKENRSLAVKQEKLQEKVRELSSVRDRLDRKRAEASIRNLEKSVEQLRSENSAMKDMIKKLAKMELPASAKKMVNTLVRSFEKAVTQERER